MFKNRSSLALALALLLALMMLLSTACSGKDSGDDGGGLGEITGQSSASDKPAEPTDSSGSADSPEPVDQPAVQPPGGAALSPAVGGAAKPTEDELDKLISEADALFTAPPLPNNGKEITLAEYKSLIDSLQKSQKSGNTRYAKFLESHYNLDDGKWAKNEMQQQRIIEAWHKESNTANFKFLTRWEFLCILDGWSPEKAGDTDCYIDLYDSIFGNHECYNWLKSETTGRSLLPATPDLIFSDIKIHDEDGSQYYTFPDQTVNGRPCKVFGSTSERDWIMYWFATDIGRTLIAAKWDDGGYMDFYYSYDEIYLDAEDSLFDPPGNVTFAN